MKSGENRQIVGRHIEIFDQGSKYLNHRKDPFWNKNVNTAVGFNVHPQTPAIPDLRPVWLDQK